MIEKNNKSFALFVHIIHKNNEFLVKELLALQKNPFMNQQDREFSLHVLITNLFINWVDTLPKKERETQEAKFKRESKIFRSGRKSLEQFIASKILNHLIVKEI